MVEITYYNGAKLVLEGPVEFTVKKPNACRLDLGKLTAKVSEQAAGFTVETPNMSIVDFGTEFAVEVEQGGDADVHVFVGEVEVAQDVGGVRRKIRLGKGQSVRFDAGTGKLVALPAGSAQFARAASFAATAGSLAAHYAWTPETAPQGKNAPALVPFRDGHALKFTRADQTRLSLGQGPVGRLRLTGALTLAAVVQVDALPPEKKHAALISKWLMSPWHSGLGGRAYLLSMDSAGRPVFSISADGAWPDGGKELVSTRPLEPGVPYTVAAIYEPGERIALFIDGEPCGELTEGVPESVFDSPAPVWLGNCYRNEHTHGFDGLIAQAWFYSTAMDDEAVADLTQPEKRKEE